MSSEAAAFRRFDALPLIAVYAGREVTDDEAQNAALGERSHGEAFVREALAVNTVPGLAGLATP